MTDHDWKMNRQVSIRKVPDPTQQNHTIGVYAGMYEYFFAPRSSNRPGVENKYTCVLRNMRQQIEANPGFAVRATGHSMGGSLATLFALYAASTEDWMPHIQIVTFGGPRIGDVAFFRAFRRLEVAQKVSKLRVVNHEDVVPTLPDLTVAPQPLSYHHVGVELRLYTNLWNRSPDSPVPRYTLSIPDEPRNFPSVLRRDLTEAVRRCETFFWLTWQQLHGHPAFIELSAMHHCMEYIVRVERDRSELSQMKIPQIKSTIDQENK
jgi:hypothetical protein